MTAPDSVERVVAEMRIPHEGGWDNDDVDALADRLQALARGPTINPAETDSKLIGAQQAGGEDGVEVAPLYVELEIEAALGHAGRTSERLMRMAAEAKALLHRALAAEAALREAQAIAEAVE